MNALIGLVIGLAVIAWMADTLIEAIKADPQPWIAGVLIVALGPVTLLVRRIVRAIRARKTAPTLELDKIAARFRIQPQPVPHRLMPPRVSREPAGTARVEQAPAPARELVVLFTDVRVEMLVRYCARGRTEDLRFVAEELLGFETGGVLVARGMNRITGERRNLAVKNITHVGDPETGEITTKRSQWLKAQAAESVLAGQGRKVHEPVKPRRRKISPTAGAAESEG